MRLCGIRDKLKMRKVWLTEVDEVIIHCSAQHNTGPDVLIIIVTVTGINDRVLYRLEIEFIHSFTPALRLAAFRFSRRTLQILNVGSAQDDTVAKHYAL